MGKEISTLGGAVATAGTAIAAGVTFGQVKALNDSVEACAKFTGKSFMDTNVRHIGEAVGSGIATAGTAVAAGVTLGQIDQLNNAVASCAEHTAKSSVAAAKTAATTLNDAADSLPVVGHVKGVIHYAAGDEEGGDRAMKAASRTTAVVGAGVGGFVVGGPVGAAAAGVLAGSAMDGVITGADSAVHGEYRPYGQIAAWTAVAEGRSAEEVVEGVVGGLTSPVMDAVGGRAAGKAKAGLKGVDVAKNTAERNPNPALNAFMKKQKNIVSGSKDPVLSRGSTASRRSTVSSDMSSSSTVPPLGKGAPRPSTATGSSTASGRSTVSSDISSSTVPPPGKGAPRPSTASTATGSSTASGRSTVSSDMSSSSTVPPPGKGAHRPSTASTATGGSTASGRGTVSSDMSSSSTVPPPGKGALPNNTKIMPHESIPHYIPDVVYFVSGPPEQPHFPSNSFVRQASPGTQGQQSPSPDDTSHAAEGGQPSESQDAGPSSSQNPMLPLAVDRPPVAPVAPVTASSYLPPSYFDNVSITPQQFDVAFTYEGNGVFQLSPGWTLAFTHAVLTTGDRPEDLETERKGTAGGLWRTCTGTSIKQNTCCVYNCTNPNCTPDNPAQAGATAHVYATFQLPEHNISYMILLPTCSMCNNWQTCKNTETNYPLEGELANVLYTVTTDGTRVVRVIFVQISEKTRKGKGGQGRGSAPGPGKGGGYHGKGGGKGGGPPPNAAVVGY